MREKVDHTMCRILLRAVWQKHCGNTGKQGRLGLVAQGPLEQTTACCPYSRCLCPTAHAAQLARSPNTRRRSSGAIAVDGRCVAVQYFRCTPFILPQCVSVLIGLAGTHWRMWIASYVSALMRGGAIQADPNRVGSWYTVVVWCHGLGSCYRVVMGLCTEIWYRAMA
jgi:hypothetical protein